MNKRTTFVAMALLTLGSVLPIAQAQSTVYWDVNDSSPGGGPDGGGFYDGTWGVDPFWSTDPSGNVSTSAWVPGDNAVFSAGSDGTADGIISISGTQTANSIVIEEGLMQFRDGTADTGAGTVTVNSGATLDINSTLRLNTGAGKVVLNGGTLMETNPGNAGTFMGSSAGLKGLEINGTGTIGYDDGDGTPDNKVSIFFGVITGTGGTTTNGGSGTLIKVGPDQIGIGVSNQGGVHSQSLFTFAKLVVEEGAYRLRTTTFDGTAQETGFGAVPLAELPDAITLNGGGIGTSGSVTLHQFRGITLGPEGGYFDHGATAGISVPGPLTGSATLTVGSPTSTSASNPQFELTNTNNVNTFTGKLHILRSTLSVPDAAALGAIPGAPVADSITLGGTATATTGPATLRFSASTTLAANRGITLAGTVDGRINIPSGGNTVAYDGVITGPGKFIKMGDGALVTAGAHTYSGGTDVYGRLIVNNTSGSGTGSGPVAIKTTSALGTNGTLGGTGSVAGAVTVESGGTIAPGASAGSIGTLSLNGGLTLGVDSILDLDLGAPSTGDLLNVLGTTTLDGGTVNVANAGGLATGTYKILDYAGALGGSFANLVLGTVPAGFSINLVNNVAGTSIDLAVTSTGGLTGDYNNDGKVDAADYVLWRNDPASHGGDPAGYNAWRGNFGNPPGSGSALEGASVPEPATLTLLIAAISGLLVVRRQR